MNRMIQSMNEWAEKREIVQERTLSGHWSSQLKKINLQHLPEKSYMNLWKNLQYIVENKKFNKVDNLKLIPIKSEWTLTQKAAIEQMNKLIDSMHNATVESCQTKVTTLTSKIEMLKLKFEREPISRTPKNQETLINWETQLKMNHQRLKNLETAIERS